jgi:hypothetical protein
MREATRSKKTFGKKSQAEAKNAETEAKRATAKAELEEIGKQIAARVTIMRNTAPSCYLASEPRYSVV